MSKCYCGAKWRSNHPHGHKSKGKTFMIVEHDKDCKHNKKNKRRRY